MTTVAFAIPGDINLATGGYAYDRRVMALLPAHGLPIQHLQLPGTFPGPSVGDLETTARLLSSLPTDAVILADGLAYGAMPAELIAPLHNPIVALVHHPLCLEAGLPKARQDALYALEKAALERARHVVVTSKNTAATLISDFDIPVERIVVAEPGTDPAVRARGSFPPPHLLSVGSIVPRKAYDVLVRALAMNRDLDWRLSIIGPTDRSPEALTKLQLTIQETELGSRITVAGAAEPRELESHYAAADVFILPSLYEGYGMVLAEAMARGLPIICTTGGAAAATVPDEAAIKVPPGDSGALGAAIRRTLEDAVLRRRMSDAAWVAGQKLPRWEDTARTIAGVIRNVASGNIAP